MPEPERRSRSDPPASFGRRGRDGFDDPRVEAGGASGSIDKGLHSHVGGRARSVLFRSKLVRTDMTEGKPGAPLSLMLQVVEAENCASLKAVRVDVWNFDGLGVYSGYARQATGSTKGETFLRGTQFTDADCCALHHQLSRLVSGPHAAYPFQGDPRRQGSRHRIPALALVDSRLGGSICLNTWGANASVTAKIIEPVI